jgi:inositol 3-alpha-galactosyltransferase
VDYGKMIYLDGDIQVFDNIDHLFEKPTGYFYAVMDCFCEKTWSTTPQYQIKYCQQCPEKVQWPLEMGSPPPLYFNAGMCLFEPKLETYFDLLETLKVTTPTSFAEQVINPACLGYLLLLFFGRLSYIIYSPLFFGYSRKEVVDLSFFN